MSSLQPLQEMISGYTRSAKQWTPTLEQQYEAVKTLGDCQKLFWMDENLPSSCMPMHQTTDAEHIFQKDSDGKEYPIQFLSKSFSVQKRWSTIEQEAYAIFYSLNEFEHLLRADTTLRRSP
jgi:hypothetical protein